MLSIGRMTAGAGYEYLTREVASNRHDYYAGRGERAGAWWGSGLERLGLAGQVTTEQMAALYGQALDPVTGEPLGRRFPVYRPLDERLAEAVEAWTTEHGTPPQGDRLVALRARLTSSPQRQAVAALDLTFSPVKTVSVLWAIAGDELRGQIEAAHAAAVSTALGHLQRVAGVTRAGVNGVRTVDAEGWIVARFTHRMSRAGDPQLHTHCAVLNRVYCPTDGRWRTLDSRAIYRLAAGAGGIYTRVLEDELATRIGVTWRDVDTGAPTPRREIDGIPEDLRRTWSKRRAQVEATLGDLDHEPRTAKARALAAQQATLHTRPTKGSPEATPHDRWQAEAQALGHDPAELATQVAPGTAAGRDGPAPAERWLETEPILDRAVERLEASSSTWRRGNLVRAVAEALPPADRTAPDAARLVERLVDRLERSGRLVAITAPEPVEVPVELRRRDGTSVYRPAAGVRYTTPGVLAAEARIVDTARQVDPALALSAHDVEPVLAVGSRGGTGAAYGNDQATAVRALCGSGRRLELLIGPAGAGKTTTMRAVVDAWQAAGRRVVGLTVAQTAARILTEQTGATAQNIARWLTMSTLHLDDPAWHLRPGDLVLVDEIGMVPTGDLDELRRQAVAAGAKLIGVGDPLQLGPVGAGGAARLVANDVGATYLTELHRFTHPWEATASLALRDGDPNAATTYDLRGRLHGGDRDTAAEQAQAAWLKDHLAGRGTLLLAASTTQVADMAAWCRDQLVHRGLVDDRAHQTVTLHDDNRAGAGDQVATRRNDRTLGVENRDVWHVERVAPDGSLAVRHATRGQSTILPESYVARHVELAYATTVHAAQGRTVDTAHAVAAMGVDRELLYVAMTRGRHTNHAYLVTDDFLHDELGGGHVEPADAFRAIIDQDPAVTSATETLRDELASADSLATWGPIADDLEAAIVRRRALAYLDHCHGSAVAHDVDTDPAAGALVALLRRSVTVGAAIDRMLATACRADLTGARSNAQVLAARVRGVLEHLADRRLDPDRLPHPDPGWATPDGALDRYHIEITDLMGQRTSALGDIAAAEPPTWAVEAWGPIPDDPTARAVWTQAAGAVSAYCERWSIDATPAQLAAQPPPARDVARWQHWHDIRGWLDLGRSAIARHESGPHADRVEAEPDRRHTSRMDRLDAALVELEAVRTALDQQPAGLAPDLGPTPAPEPPGPDLGM